MFAGHILILAVRSPVIHRFNTTSCIQVGNFSAVVGDGVRVYRSVCWRSQNISKKDPEQLAANLNRDEWEVEKAQKALVLSSRVRRRIPSLKFVNDRV